MTMEQRAINTVTRYETSDGDLFKDSDKAIEYQRLLDLEEWYDSNKLRYDGEIVPFSDLLNWMQSCGQEFLDNFNDTLTL